MNYESLMGMIEHFGYAALFFALWLGIVGMPIPDEVIVMTGGAVAASGILQTVPAFILTYLGVISGLSLGYVIGRYVGTPALSKLRRKKKMGYYIGVSERLINKYDSMSLVISYFFPVVRHVVPYLVGMNKMPFWRYGLISYSIGFVWTLAFFALGGFVGDQAQFVGSMIYAYGVKLLIFIPLAALALWLFYRFVLANRPKRVE